MAGSIEITKADGTREPFQVEKLERSLERAGVEKSEAQKLAKKIAAGITEGETTQVIYRRAFRELKRREKPAAARYSMRHALMDLGPTGYPFEHFVADIFAAQGFTTAVGVTAKGKCIEHEVDVFAYDGERRIAIEAKFHNKRGFKTDSKTTLYVEARMRDLAGGNVIGFEDGPITEGLLITNTKFTKSARAYASCMKLPTISWDYPHDGSLEELIESTGVYPVTCLSSLSKAQKRRLLEHQVSLCSTLLEREEALKAAGVPAKKAAEALEESRRLCATRS